MDVEAVGPQKLDALEAVDAEDVEAVEAGSQENAAGGSA